MLPSAGQPPGAPLGPTLAQQAPNPALQAWLGPPGCCGPAEPGRDCASAEGGPAPEPFLPLSLFPAPDPAAFGLCQPPQPCKLPLPFPTQSLPPMSFQHQPQPMQQPAQQQQQQQQSSLAATFSRLSSQLEAQFGAHPTRLLSEEGGDGEPADRDDYLMRLLRRGPSTRPAASQPSQPSEAAASTRAGPAPSRTQQPAGTAQGSPRPAQPSLPGSSGGSGGGAEGELPGRTGSGEGDAPNEPNTHAQSMTPPAHDYRATVEALGQGEAARVRATILQQQLTFTEQLYELHRAAAVQKLLMRNCAPAAGPQRRQQRVQAQQRPAGPPADTPAAPAVSPARAKPPLPPRGIERPAQPQESLAPAQPCEPAVGSQAPPAAATASLPPTLPLDFPPTSLSQPQPMALPPHMQWGGMDLGAGRGLGPGGFPPAPADPMAWWYHTHYGGAGMPQAPSGLAGFPGPGELSPRTAAAAAAAAAPAFAQQLQHCTASGISAGGAGAGRATSKWWQDAQATFGPPGDPEVVARQVTIRETCEVDSVPRGRSRASPEGVGASGAGARGGRKRKSLDPADEASSETTGRDPGCTATTTAGGSGAECASAFQRLPVRPKPTRPLPRTAEGGDGAAPEEHAAHMLLSFSSRGL